MARCAPVTDASGRPPPDDPDDRPAEDEADLGWRALAGSLDDLGFAPRAAREAAADSGPIGPAAADPAVGYADPDADPADPAADAADPYADPAGATDPDPVNPTDATLPYADPDATASGHPRALQFSRGAIGLIITMLALSILIGGGFSYQLYDKAVIAPGATADIEEFVDVADHPRLRLRRLHLPRQRPHQLRPRRCSR